MSYYIQWVFVSRTILVISFQWSVRHICYEWHWTYNFFRGTSYLLCQYISAHERKLGLTNLYAEIKFIRNCKQHVNMMTTFANITHHELPQVASSQHDLDGGHKHAQYKRMINQWKSWYHRKVRLQLKTTLYCVVNMCVNVRKQVHFITRLTSDMCGVITKHYSKYVIKWVSCELREQRSRFWGHL